MRKPALLAFAGCIATLCLAACTNTVTVTASGTNTPTSSTSNSTPAAATTAPANPSPTANIPTAVPTNTTAPALPTATSTPVTAPYAGTWINDNANTGDVPKLTVAVAGSTLTVHGYGACSPYYCDWGTRSGPFTTAPFIILFDFGGNLTQTLSLTADSTGLKVVDTGSASGTNAMHFHRLTTADYAGVWLNDDPSTADVPEVIVTASGAAVAVHAYGACVPKLCDWGAQTITLTGDPVVATFDFSGGLKHTLNLALDGPKLQITDIGTSSGTTTMYFHH